MAMRIKSNLISKWTASKLTANPPSHFSRATAIISVKLKFSPWKISSFTFYAIFTLSFTECRFRVSLKKAWAQKAGELHLPMATRLS